MTEAPYYGYQMWFDRLKPEVAETISKDLDGDNLMCKLRGALDHITGRNRDALHFGWFYHKLELIEQKALEIIEESTKERDVSYEDYCLRPHIKARRGLVNTARPFDQWSKARHHTHTNLHRIEVNCAQTVLRKIEDYRTLAEIIKSHHKLEEPK